MEGRHPPPPPKAAPALLPIGGRGRGRPRSTVVLPASGPSRRPTAAALGGVGGVVASSATTDAIPRRRSPRVAAMEATMNAMAAVASNVTTVTAGAAATAPVQRGMVTPRSSRAPGPPVGVGIGGRGRALAKVAPPSIVIPQVTKAFSAIKISKNGTGGGGRGGQKASASTSTDSSAPSSASRGHDSNNNFDGAASLPLGTTPKIQPTTMTNVPNFFMNSSSTSLQPRKSERMVDAALLRNPDAGACLFCSVDLAPQEGIMVDACLHLFCKDCLQSAIEMQPDSAQIPCPIDCDGFLSDAEVKELVSPDVYQEYLSRSLVIAKKKMKNVFSCLNPGCTSWCEFEQGRKTFYCPQCKQDNCMECQAIHTGVDCATFATLKQQGRLATVEEMVAKERKNGWAQLTEIMEASGDGQGSIQDILTRTDLLENKKEFECSICFADVPPGEGVILHECLHMFCKECLVNLVDHSEEPMVKCPYIDGNYSCVNQLQAREIKRLVPQLIYDKYLQRSLKLGESSIENSFHCKSPDCLGWTVVEEGDTRFQCEICKKINCIPCQVLHDGTCEDYKNRVQQNENDKLSEQAVEELIRKGDYMRCSKCKIPVQKMVGCDWLQCLVCRTELCWATKGPRWGPKGKGDTTGGCRCKVNGKKCHPRCGNCH